MLSEQVWLVFASSALVGCSYHYASDDTVVREAAAKYAAGLADAMMQEYCKRYKKDWCKDSIVEEDKESK